MADEVPARLAVRAGTAAHAAGRVTHLSGERSALFVRRALAAAAAALLSPSVRGATASGHRSGRCTSAMTYSFSSSTTVSGMALKRSAGSLIGRPRCARALGGVGLLRLAPERL